MSLRVLALASLALAAAPSVARAEAAFVPPVRFDIGSIALRGEHGTSLSTQMLIGLHWASLHPGNPTWDVGLGLVTAYTSLPDNLRFTDGRKDTDGYVGATGGYLELGKRIAGGEHWRTWLSGRGELTRGELVGRHFTAVGAAARLTTELFTGLAGGGRGGLILGAAGIGVYAEATYREQPSQLGETGFGAGVSFRLPLILATR